MQFTIQVALRPPDHLTLYRVIDWHDFSAVVAGADLRDQLKFFLRQKNATGVKHLTVHEYSDYEFYALNEAGQIIVAFDSESRELIEEFLKTL